MGYQQRASAGIASFAVALFAACGGGGAKSKPAPVPVVPDAGGDVEREAAQIEAIAGALNEFSPAVHTCWARGAADGYELDGQVVIGLEIGSDGLAEVELKEENVGDAVLIECLLSLWASYRWPPIFDAGDRIQLPPFDFVAPTAQYSVALGHVPVHEIAGGKLEVQIVLDEANTGNGQAGMSVLSARDGLEVPLHTHDSAELLFVLNGRGRMTGIGAAQAVEPGTAIYIPAGVVHGFVQEGADVTELVQLYAPGGAEQRFKDPENTAGTTPFVGKLPRRGPRPLVKTAAGAKSFAIGGGTAEVRIIVDEPISGDAAAYVGALTAQPGATIPLHRHANSSEFLLVLEGSAAMNVAGKEIRIHPGDAVQIPKTVEHGATIADGETFKALQFYAPAGPEQRFKGAGAGAQ